VISDLLAVAGLALLAVGLWMFRPWVALAVVGAVLMGVSVMLARAAK